MAYIDSVTAPVRKALGYPVEELCVWGGGLSFDSYRNFIRANDWFSFLPESLYTNVYDEHADRQFSFELLRKIYRSVEKIPNDYLGNLHMPWQTGIWRHSNRLCPSLTHEDFFSRFVQLQMNLMCGVV